MLKSKCLSCYFHCKMMLAQASHIYIHISVDPLCAFVTDIGVWCRLKGIKRKRLGKKGDRGCWTVKRQPLAPKCAYGGEKGEFKSCLKPMIQPS